VHTGFVRKHEGKRPLGRPWCRREMILKWIFKKCDGEAWTGLLWFRWALVNAVRNHWFHKMHGIS
jgi:hypothetical protein